jgi:peptidoglycan/LPS O-acetylase OafA/YrhL
VKDARTEVPELNGLRALAALAVMLCHAKTVFDHARWATVVARWARSGWLGVDLFFVLSGYLLTRGLYELREGPHYYRRFYARRVARIFPLYYLYLAGVFAVAARVALPPHLFAPRDGDLTRFAVYLGNAVYAERWPGLLLALFWSLAVEEHFYLVWPAAFRRSRSQKPYFFSRSRASFQRCLLEPAFQTSVSMKSLNLQHLALSTGPPRLFQTYRS